MDVPMRIAGQRQRRVTRADVARAAGTSTAVVSYVLNDGPRPVAQATRRRVLEAVEAIGYRPDSIARALASGATRTLGLVVPDIANPFFAALAHALEDEASRHGLVFLLGDAAEHRERQHELIDSFVTRRVDGLVVVGVDDDLDLEPARQAGLPVVVLDRILGDADASAVGIDNQAAAGAATEHLLEHGRRRIALVTGPDWLPTAVARERGWRDALEAAGLEPDPSLVRRTGFNRSGGYEAGTDLFRLEHAPDAVFVASEQQAVGLLRAAHEARTAVPDTVAVVAIDGTEAAEYCVPSLTTIAQPFDELARRAIELVGQPAGTSRTAVCDFDLVLRSSCGCESPQSRPRT
ncbi:LacI family DNA-binding transcriptional regulator [Georgenia halophila]|uniref:LacI family DNA-binding transcriptional regulator n=1 Tax=Georgenia halophila TaxID=620889 RepID=A0ABP8LNS2_9MICO